MLVEALYRLVTNGRCQNLSRMHLQLLIATCNLCRAELSLSRSISIPILIAILDSLVHAIKKNVLVRS